MESPQTPQPLSSLVSEQPNLKLQKTTAISEPQEAELDDEEREAVLKAAREAKAKKLANAERDRQYWQRVNEPATMTPDALGNWILAESKRFDEQDQNPRYIGPNGFVLDEHSRPVFDLLCMYFTNHPDFEQAGKHYDQFAESRFSLKKGIALVGPTGVGKTAFMWLFCDNPRQSFTITPCKVALEAYEGASNTSEGNQLFSRFAEKSDVYRSKFRQGLGGRAFDDLGTETVPAVLFNKKRNLMLDLLERRYEMGPQVAGLTHLTTNLTSNQIEEIYGKRLRSRFREMFNLIKFDPKTPDRRE